MKPAFSFGRGIKQPGSGTEQKEKEHEQSVPEMNRSRSDGDPEKRKGPGMTRASPVEGEVFSLADGPDKSEKESEQ